MALLKNINPASELNFFTGISLMTYSPVVKYFLDNPDFSKNFQSLESSLWASDFIFFVGLYFLALGALFLVIDKNLRFQLSGKQALIQYFLTAPLTVVLCITPALETFYPGSSFEAQPVVYSIIIILTLVGTLGALIAHAIFLVNVLIGIIGLFTPR